MNSQFELMDQRSRDSRIAKGGGKSLSSRSHRYPPTLIDTSEEMFAATLWRIIRSRNRLIAAFASSVVAIVLIASLLMKPQYDATDRIVFHRETDSGVLGFKVADTSLVEDPEDRAAIDTQIGILETDALAIMVINELHLDKNPRFSGATNQPANEDQLIAKFHKNLTISKVKGTRLIEIKFRNGDPKLAADVVNNLAKAYVDQYYRSQFQVSAQISDFLANQVKELQSKVEESRKKLVDYQKEKGIFGLDEKQNIVTSKLDDLNRQLTAAESNRVEKEVDYRLARLGQPDLIAKLEPGSLMAKLRSQQADLQTELAQASVQLGPAHPKIVELSNQLAQTRQAIDSETARVNQRITFDFKSASQRESLLHKALEKQKQVADTLNANEIQSNILKHEFETNQKLYEDLVQKQKEVGISASLKSSNIWIVDPARPPRLPAEPNIPRNLALSLVFGAFGGVLLAFGLTKMNEKISTLEQALVLSPLPSLGVVPLLGARAASGAPARGQIEAGNGSVKPELVSFLQPLSLAAESYKAMLTSILLSQSTPPTVILVTSALPGEGKTTVSTNLAIVLARLRRRVLLVDADLRRPSIHRAMRLSSTVGLGALLRKSTAFEDAAVSCSDVPNLSILPAGLINLPDDTELLVAGFKDLVKCWRGQFDHIIVDTPPVLPMTDAVRMSVEADSVVLVIRCGQIAKDEFLRAQDLLLKVNAHLTGFVLNGVDLRSTDFQHYYGYYGQDDRKRLSGTA